MKNPKKKLRLKTHKLLCICIVLSLSTLNPFSILSAQNYSTVSGPHGIPLLNSSYSPLTPDYFEIEDCNESINNWPVAPGNVVPETGLCSELIDFPVEGATFVLQGSVQDEPVYDMSDNYVFEVSKYTKTHIRLSTKHQIYKHLMLITVPDDLFNCIPGTSQGYMNWAFGENYNNWYNQGDLEVTPILPPGKYRLRVMLSPNNSGVKTGCSELEYQLVLSNLEEYEIGQICQGAIEVFPANTFNESRVMDNMANGYPHGDFGCAVNDLGQNERWYKFTAITQYTFIQALRGSSGNFDGAIEVYEGCGGAPIWCQDDYVGNNEIAIVPTLWGQEYYYRIYHNGAQAQNGNAFSTALARIPTTSLSPADCGRMNLTSADIIRSGPPANTFLLTQWEFQFRLQGSPWTVHNIVSPNGSNPQFRLHWFPQAIPGSTYAVRTRPRMYQGPTWGDWGAPCVIGFAPAPSGLMAYQGSDQEPGISFTSYNLGLQLWPNPTSGEFTISLQTIEEDNNMDIGIYDISGKLVDREMVATSGHTQFNYIYDSSKLSPGLYIVQVRTGSAWATSKIAVNR